MFNIYKKENQKGSLFLLFFLVYNIDLPSYINLVRSYSESL